MIPKRDQNETHEAEIPNDGDKADEGKDKPRDGEGDESSKGRAGNHINACERQTQTHHEEALMAGEKRGANKDVG